MNNKKLRRMVIIAMLASVATVLMQFNFPLPAIPAFLKLTLVKFLLFLQS